MISYQPVIIIGAPRSGTNILRDVLSSFQGAATWPCDEINYIWRHGNIRYPSDELVPELVDQKTSQYIRSQFDWVASKYNADFVIEKTCANSLRIPFVDRIIPDAMYIFIQRDGLDVVGSSMLRWNAPLDLAYLARKARFVPVQDVAYYGSKYVWNRIYRIISGKRRLAFWGPKLSEMEDLLNRYSLEEVCALQWKNCVEKAGSALADMSSDRVISIKYEDFVKDPINVLEQILSFIGINYHPKQLKHAAGRVSSGSIGKGRSTLSDSTIDALISIMGDTLERYGY